MQEFILSCCSTADITKEHFARRNLRYICFHYILNGVEYPDDLGESIPFDRFYRMVAEGVSTSTSQVNVEEFIDYFTPFLQEGKDILHVSFSSGLSGTSNSAFVAAKQLQAQFPDRKILVVDSLCGSSGYGLLMDKLADLRDSGYDIDRLYEYANQNKLRVQHIFFSSDLSAYIKGGRISKTAGVVGTILNICPILNMSHEGKLVPRSKAIGKKGAIKKLLAKMEQLADNGLCYDEKCYISHSACLDDAKMLAGMINDRFPRTKEIAIYDVGTTIGSHTGCGTVALFFWGTPRND